MEGGTGVHSGVQPGRPVAAPSSERGGSFFLPPGVAGEGDETESCGGRLATRCEALVSSVRNAPKELGSAALLGRSAVVARRTPEARNGGTDVDCDVQAVSGLLPSSLIDVAKKTLALTLRVACNDTDLHGEQRHNLFASLFFFKTLLTLRCGLKRRSGLPLGPLGAPEYESRVNSRSRVPLTVLGRQCPAAVLPVAFLINREV